MLPRLLPETHGPTWCCHCGEHGWDSLKLDRNKSIAKINNHRPRVLSTFEKGVQYLPNGSHVAELTRAHVKSPVTPFAYLNSYSGYTRNQWERSTSDLSKHWYNCILTTGDESPTTINLNPTKLCHRLPSNICKILQLNVVDFITFYMNFACARYLLI